MTVAGCAAKRTSRAVSRRDRALLADGLAILCPVSGDGGWFGQPRRSQEEGRGKLLSFYKLELNFFFVWFNLVL